MTTHTDRRQGSALGTDSDPTATAARRDGAGDRTGGVLGPQAVATPSARAPSPGRADRPALLVEHLTKRFGDRTAVDDLSLTVAQGEVFGFLGPNGAGKTTTVRLLGTLIEPTAGAAVVAGLPLTPANGVAIRQRIAIMPESPGLYLRLTVRENLEFFAGLYSLRDPRGRITHALDAVSMASRADDLCGSLSKGLRQRIGLARALLNEPAVLFLDEPTSGLDPVAAREVHELIDGLRKRGVTIFLTTHRLEEAERLCDRVAIVSTTLRSVGRPDELRNRLFKPALAVQTGVPLAAPAAVFDPIAAVEGWSANGDGAGEGEGRYLLTVSDVRTAAPEVARALVAAGADILSLAASRHSLEDVYLQLIDEDVEAQARGAGR